MENGEGQMNHEAPTSKRLRRLGGLFLTVHIVSAVMGVAAAVTFNPWLGALSVLLITSALGCALIQSREWRRRCLAADLRICPHCGYELPKTDAECRCPECGRDWEIAYVRSFWRRRFGLPRDESAVDA